MKNFLLPLILCFTVLRLSAQGSDEQKFRFGFKVSPNLAWIKADSKNFTRDAMRLTFSYGLMGDYRLGSNYAISTELLISTMGGKVTFDSIAPNPITTGVFPGGSGYIRDVSYTYKTQYVQLPISLKMKTKEIGYITYWAQFGFAPSFLLKAKADISSSPLQVKSNAEDLENVDVNQARDEYIFFDDNVNFFRVSLILGAGIEYSITEKTSLYAGFRFDNGFTDVFNDKNTKGFNNYMALSVGVFF